MSALLITYDLNKPGQNYGPLYEKIKGLGTWWHYLDSTWVVDTYLTPTEANERLRTALDDSDSVLIVNITNDTYAGWLEQDAWNWLKTHV
ncbi:hypothetical protein [Mycobacterium haemophilum]